MTYIIRGQIVSTFQNKIAIVSYNEYGLYSIESDGWYLYVEGNGKQITIRMYDRSVIDDRLQVFDFAKWCEEGLQWSK